MKKRIKNIISYVLLIISGLLCAATLYIMFRFQHVTFEQLIYSLLYSRGSSISAIGEGLIVGGVIFIIYLGIILFPFYGKWKVKKINVFPMNREFFFSYAVYMFLLMFVVSGLFFGMFKYLYYQFDTSNIFEDNYIDPKKVKITLPDKKKNLVYIFVESLEMSSVSSENGGLIDKSYIPNLEKLALENTNFSHNGKLGGAKQVNGTTWTIGGMVAETAGIPFKVMVHHNKYNHFSSFLHGAYSLGEILKDNGYQNYIMMGSDASFAGRGQYFQEHGNYQLLDYNWAKKKRLIRDSYNEWWGYEDSKLFKFAKDELLNISDKKEPFNFTILTADTHFPDGYIDKSCWGSEYFSTHYANSFYCTDKMVSEFVKWLKEQEFYKDTVVIIVGDHLTMQKDFYSSEYLDKRSVYNVIINSDLNTNYNKNRLFTTIDMYPTTLAALGANISGNKLGLGVNLYTGDKTLVEEYGFDYVNRELNKKSKFYDKYILGNTYKEMYEYTNHEYED